MLTAAPPQPLAAPEPHVSGGETAIRLDALTKDFPVRRTWGQMLRHPFGGSMVRAVNNASFTVHCGEVFGLLGPNGAGKTTLFKMLMTSTSPDSGHGSIFEYDIQKDARKVRRLVGCVMASDRSLYWRLSARENLRLFASLYKLHGREAAARIEEVLRTVELSDTGEKMVATFSSGMRQRLLIARALLSRPRVLLLDEPTRALDPISARNFRELIRTQVAGREGCTVMLATHSSDEAMDLCSRVAILDRGELLAVGTTAEIGDRYNDQAYSLWTRTPGHSALVMLDVERKIRLVETSACDARGWFCVRLSIPGGCDRSADVLAYLVASGLDVARFEQVNLSLADLLERVVQGRATGAP